MRSLLFGIALTVLLVAGTFYVAVGTPNVSHSPATTESSTPLSVSTSSSSSDDKLGSVESMTGGLEERLRQQPEDGKGWLLLAKSYRHMGRLEEARQAYRKADALGNGDETVAAQLNVMGSGKVNSVMEAQLEDMEMSQ